MSDAGQVGPVDGGPASADDTAEDGLQPARWFSLEGRERRGPVLLAEVRELILEGSLGPDDYVWADGMEDWLHVRDVPALVPPPALRMTLPAWPDEPTATSGGTSGALP
jgi:hypothetical protein